MEKKYAIYVRTEAQKEIFVHELQGQLSDGHWENENTDRRLWNCDVYVSEKPGRTFNTKYPVDFNDSDLIEVVGDRMIGYARRVAPNYDQEKLLADLDELTQIVYGLLV